MLSITTDPRDSVSHLCYILYGVLQYIPRNMHTVFALLCFVVVIHWLIFPYPSGLLHWHCDNLTIAPVPAKQPWWIWIDTSCEFIMNDCINTTKQSTTKPCAYFLRYTVYVQHQLLIANITTYQRVKTDASVIYNTIPWMPVFIVFCDKSIIHLFYYIEAWTLPQETENMPYVWWFWLCRPEHC